MRYVLIGTVLTLAACGGGGAGDGGVGPGVTYSLRNDGFAVTGAAFQAGFVTGEEAAVTLGPVPRGFQVKLVRFLYGGAATARTVTLKIYGETGTATPGTLLHSADFFVTPSDTAIQELDITGSNVTLPAGSVRVSILFQDGGLPSVATDGDGITPNRNWAATAAPAGWYASSDLGVAGDWIIRAEVETL